MSIVCDGCLKVLDRLGDIEAVFRTQLPDLFSSLDDNPKMGRERHLCQICAHGLNGPINLAHHRVHSPPMTDGERNARS
jgi:hypothetical protein